MEWLTILALVSWTSSSTTAQRFSSLPPPCDSRIFCHGPLLHTVQMSNLGGPFNDSKYFVDMPMRMSPAAILRNYEQLIVDTNNNPTSAQILRFVEDNFKKPGTEFEPWDPQDWTPIPEFLKDIEDPALEAWAEDLNELWKELGRKIKREVQNEKDKYSLLYISNPFIVPGGRFRETYYWDSYWTMEGLLLSEMVKTVKGMLENFFEMVRVYGFVPNGGRIYYTRRSQPPYLIPMAKLYYDYSKDADFIRRNIDLLEMEFLYWEANRTVPITGRRGRTHRVAQYNVEVGEPRPEGYKEDYLLAENLPDEESKQRLYVQLKSGAESGWDFSTRWFVDGDTNKGNMTNLNLTSIAPVDLNSLLCHNARTLSDFYELLGNASKAQEYLENANEKNQTMADIFWDETDGTWYDFNIITNRKRRYFYLSNVHPLWSGCFGREGSRNATVQKVIDYLKKKNVINYIGGVPTSLKNSSEQWDFPNAWAPLQHHVIMGLHEARDINEEAGSLAFELAEKWIQTNYIGYQEAKSMFEKYDVTVEGVAGTGGEYEVVTGFGWTNGVAMKLLDTFGDRLVATVGGSVGSALVFPSLLLASILFALLLQ